MGCLNSEGQFSHWFGNIHLSGPCNRSCYFCIGQHMQSLEDYNVLDKWPLVSLSEFVARCHDRSIREVNITGSNTDPLLYEHLDTLITFLKDRGFSVGIRTNGVGHKERMVKADRVSISSHSFDPSIYRRIMGSGSPPNLKWFVDNFSNVKLNVVLVPENRGADLLETIASASALGIHRINLREPYGQPHQGNPFQAVTPDDTRHGMPLYRMGQVEVVYWDVHYVEVESVNLYASGNVSETYPITKGYDSAEGKVLDQSHWKEAKRHLPQWRNR